MTKFDAAKERLRNSSSNSLIFNRLLKISFYRRIQLDQGTEWKPNFFSCHLSGKNPTDEYLEGMMSEAPGPINFTMFLTMFGEKLNGTDPEDVIRNAFACFDEEATGMIRTDPFCNATGNFLLNHL